MHACLWVYFITLSLPKCQGIGWLLIYLGLSSFSSLNLFSKAYGTNNKGESVQEVPVERGKKYSGDREKSFIFCDT